MTVNSAIRCIPDMARVWAVKSPEKAAWIDGDRVVAYAGFFDKADRGRNGDTATSL